MKAILQEIPDTINLSPLHPAILRYTRQALALTGGGTQHTEWYNAQLNQDIKDAEQDVEHDAALVNMLLAAATQSAVPEQYMQDCEYYKQLLQERKISLLRPLESLDQLKSVIESLKDSIQAALHEQDEATQTFQKDPTPANKMIVDELQERIDKAGSELAFRTQERNARADFMEELNAQLKPVMAFGLKVLRQLITNLPTQYWKRNPFCLIQYEKAAAQNAPNALSKILYKEYPTLAGAPPSRRYAANPNPNAFLQTLCSGTPYSVYLEATSQSIEMFPKRQQPDVQIGQNVTLTLPSGKQVSYVVQTVHSNADVDLEVTDLSQPLPPQKSFCRTDSGDFVYINEHILLRTRVVRVTWCIPYTSRVAVRTSNYASTLRGIIVDVNVAAQTFTFRTFSFMAYMALAMNTSLTAPDSFTAAVFNTINGVENGLLRLMALAFLTAQRDDYLEAQDLQPTTLGADYDRSDAPETILDGIENGETRKQFVEAISVAKMFLIEQWSPGQPLHAILDIENVQDAVAQLQALAKRERNLKAYSCSDSLLQLLRPDAPDAIARCSDATTTPSYEEFFNITQDETPRPVTALGKRPPIAFALPKRFEGGCRTLGNYQST